ncbi:MULTISPECIES: hypothetical protein [Cyanobium]|uniref:hypothetical protein n=1 Tax=Cyanobium TaxID=167375 RepID=UPI000FCA4BB4|nr:MULTISPECIES: hypothetical protein [Cyanobium]MCP9779281.1 hypothetical protein [Cyanobium sp. To12R1]MCP9822352.1 hypothetical protein [Cyanobium sp. L1E-Cus]
MSQAKSVAKIVLTAIAVVGGVWAGAKRAHGMKREKQIREDDARQYREDQIKRIREESGNLNSHYSFRDTTGIQDVMELFIEVEADNGEWQCVESAGMQDFFSHPEAISQTRKIAKEYSSKARLVDKYQNLYSHCDENGVFWNLSS